MAMVRPIIPLIEYYANYNYIATVLCENKDRPYLECNGKCYLEKQLKETDHSNHDHKSTIPSIDFKDYPVSPLDQFSYKTKEFNYQNSTQFFVDKYTTQDFYKSIFKPPKYFLNFSIA